MSTGTPAPGVSSAGGLFLRQSSGLVRQLGVSAAVGISLAAVTIVNVFINFNVGLTAFPKSDMILPLLIAAGIWVLGMFAYRYLLEAIPRAGGEYVYLSRTISPAAGAMMGIGVAMVYIYILSAGAHFAAAFTPFMLTGLGSALGSGTISGWASEVTSQTATLLICVGMLLIVAVLSYRPVRSLARLILALVILQVVTFFGIGVLLLFHSHSDFVAAFARFSHHPGAYQAVMTAAHGNSVPVGTSLTAMLLVVPFMVLNYFGVIFSYYVGGEIRKPGNTYVLASSISLAILLVLWIGTWLLMRRTVGLDFMQSQAGLAATNGPAYDKISNVPAVSGGLGYGLVLSGDPITKILFATAVPIAQITNCLALVAVATRIIFAMAFDRLLPVSFAKVSERLHIPVVGISIALAGGLGFAVLTTYVDIANIVANLALFSALILLAGSLAAVALPLRRPDLCLKPGATDVDRWFGVPKITVVGLLSTIGAGATITEIIAKSEIFGKFTIVSVMSLIIVLLAGPVIYAISRAWRWRKASIDLRLAMHELPPE